MAKAGTGSLSYDLHFGAFLFCARPIKEINDQIRGNVEEIRTLQLTDFQFSSFTFTAYVISVEFLERQIVPKHFRITEITLRRVQITPKTSTNITRIS